MKVCDFCDIVYDAKYCPLCDAREKIQDLEDRNEVLESDNVSLRNRVDYLEHGHDEPEEK